MFNVDKKDLYLEGFSGKLGYISWDSELFGKRIYSLSDVTITSGLCVYTTREIIDNRLMYLGADLVITRIKQSDITKINLLEKLGFGFIELNYRPFKLLDSGVNSNNRDFVFELATKDEVSIMASRSLGVFNYGRYHQDTRLDNALADERYKNWLLNAVKVESQSVLICKFEGKPVAFFVIEKSGSEHCFLSLVAMLTEYQGKGLATPIWNALLNFLELQGYHHFSTSISSHNEAAFNLYVKLGFRFPEPEMTLHKWVN